MKKTSTQANGLPNPGLLPSPGTRPGSDLNVRDVGIVVRDSRAMCMSRRKKFVYLPIG